METLKQVHEAKSAIGVIALVSIYRLTNQWEELLVWMEQHRQQVEASPQLLPTELRALGETGDRQGMVEYYDRHRQRLALLPTAAAKDMCRVTLFAFCGRRREVESLFTGRLAILPAATRAFWLATSDLAAGESDSATHQLQELLPAADPPLRRAIEHRLSQISLPQLPLDAEAENVLDELAREHGHEKQFAVRRPLFSGRSLATQALIVLNLLMFLVEISVGDSTDWHTLYRLGAFFTPAIQEGQWWRIITPLFLHCGALHLTMNLLGLWILGPFTEFALGFWRFLLVYLVSGIGWSVMVFLLDLGANEPTIMVGASGCVMGLVGATGALMLRGWLREKAIAAKRRLIAVLLIVVVQTVSDYIVPHVSMTAHLSGLIIGFGATIFLSAIPGQNPADGKH
jgi:rhomboid protease GluP